MSEKTAGAPPAGPLAATRIAFDEFILDVGHHRLWRGTRALRLRPKTWRVLCFLVERAGQLVTRETLHGAVWHGAAVTDDTLTQSIGELRRALGDSARKPRYIETVHRLGFRFVAHPRPIDAAATAPARPSSRIGTTADMELAPAEVDGTPDGAATEASAFVGRAEELKRLRTLFARARRGVRQIVLIGGETGIGKTSLVEEFLTGVRPQIDGAVLRGQCVQQYGTREPYMPILEAIERHARGAGAAALLPLVRRVAPHVYPLLTSLHAEAESARSPAAPAPPSYDRLLRELAALLESLGADACLVLVLEDLHWSDAATMDLLLLLAQRPDPANLLVIGTYRPAEAALHEHPVRDLRRRFRTQRRHTDLALGYLSSADVEAYLHLRFGLRDPDLTRAIRERTDGNPLFIVMVVDQLVRQGDLRRVGDRWVAATPAQRAVPDDLREVIAQQLRNVGGAELPVLEAASVAGIRFDPLLLARALARDQEALEAACDRLAQSHLFLQKVTTPSAPGGAAYEFTHALQQQVIYDQIPELRRRRLHRAIGTELESAQGADAAAHAPELSAHYESAGLLTQAVEHLQRCVARAQQRGAHRQAAAYVEHALRLLERLPAGTDRQRRELALRLLFGVSLNITHGYVAPEVLANLDRARALCEAAGDDRQLFEIVSAIWYVQLGGREGDAQRSLQVLAGIADRLDAPELRRRVALSRGRTAFWNGQFPAAVAMLGAFLDEVRGDAHRAGVVYGVAPTVAAFMQRGLALWFVGCPDQARKHARAGLEFAAAHAGPFDVASSYGQAALLELLSRNEPGAARYAEQCLAICRSHDVGFFQSMATCIAAASSGDADPRRLVAMRTALDDQRAQVGAFFSGVIQTYIAATYGRMRKWDDAIRCVEDGIESARDCLERIAEAELWRLRGELLIGRASRRQRSGARHAALPAEAQQSFARALDVAAEQGARAWALRTRTSLARHAANGPQRTAALAELARLYDSFTEGFDAPDLIDAQALLRPTPSGRRRHSSVRR